MEQWSSRSIRVPDRHNTYLIPYTCLSGFNTNIFIFISFYFVLICSPHIDHKTRKHRNWFIFQPQIIRVFMTKPSEQHQRQAVMNPNNQNQPSPATPLLFNTLPSFTTRTCLTRSIYPFKISFSISSVPAPIYLNILHYQKIYLNFRVLYPFL